MSSREQERKALRLIPYPSPAARSMISCGDVQRRIACCRSERPSHADTQERRTLKSASGREEEERGGVNWTHASTTRPNTSRPSLPKSIVTRRIRYRLGSMNTASLVGSGRFFLSATLSRPVRCDRSPRWLEQLQQFDCVENGLLRRNHGATGGLDGRGGRWP